MQKYNFQKCLECYHGYNEHTITNDQGLLKIECHNEDNREFCGCNGGFTQQFVLSINKEEVNK